MAFPATTAITARVTNTLPCVINKFASSLVGPNKRADLVSEGKADSVKRDAGILFLSKM